MLVEEPQILGDETEIPSSVVTDDNAENQKDAEAIPSPESDKPADEPDAPAEKSEENPQGLSSRFAAAKAKALAARETEDAPAAAAVPEEKPIDETDESEADEKVPADEKAATENDDPKADAKTSRRGENFKQVQTERDAMKLRVETLDAQFEKHGGIDVVETAIDVLDKLSTGNITDVLNDLPKAARAKAQQTIFESALQSEENRIFGVNTILRQDFGLNQDLPKPLMEKIFEFAAVRFTEDPEDFEALLDRELEFASTTERELARAKAENERLKKQPPTEPALDREAEDFAAFQTRIDTTYNDFEDSTFAKISSEKFSAFGLDVKPTDTPAIKEAKEYFAAAVKHQVGVEMRTARAFESLLPFWIENETDKPMFKNAAGAYERAMKGKVEQSLKVLSRLFGAKTAKAPDVPAPAAKPANPINNLANGQNNRSSITPRKTENQQSGGFSSKFQAAKQTATNR